MKRVFPFHSHAAWPPTWLIVVFMIVYGMVELGLWFIRLAMPAAAEGFSDMEEVKHIRMFILGGTACAIAIYRLWRFHPACSPAYAAWLKLSPWTAGRPLPLGPVHPVWQDAAMIAALAALARWHAQVDPSIPVIAFALTYLIGMTLLLAYTRTWSYCLILGFLWPSLILPIMKGWPAAGPLAAMVVAVCLGYRESLRRFPWTFLPDPRRTREAGADSLLQAEIRIGGLGSEPGMRGSAGVGWPFLALSPKADFPSISNSTSFWISLLVGWWAYCAITSFEIERSAAGILLFSMMAAIFRLTFYCSGVTPSFSVWGRLASGRIIVPGFDKVFLTPLAVVLAGVVGGIIIRLSGAWYPVAEAGVIALVCLVLFSGGPTLRRWKLTGWHRYLLRIRPSANRQMLKPV